MKDRLLIIIELLLEIQFATKLNCIYYNYGHTRNMRVSIYSDNECEDMIHQRDISYDIEPFFYDKDHENYSHEKQTRLRYIKESMDKDILFLRNIIVANRMEV